VRETERQEVGKLDVCTKENIQTVPLHLCSLHLYATRTSLKYSADEAPTRGSLPTTGGADQAEVERENTAYRKESDDDTVRVLCRLVG